MDQTSQTLGPRLYSQPDVTARCRVSRSQIYNLMQRGQFPQPVLRLGPKFTRWSASDVDAWASDPARWIARHAEAVEGVAA